MKHIISCPNNMGLENCSSKDIHRANYSFLNAMFYVPMYIHSVQTTWIVFPCFGTEILSPTPPTPNKKIKIKEQ